VATSFAAKRLITPVKGLGLSQTISSFTSPSLSFGRCHEKGTYFAHHRPCPRFSLLLSLLSSPSPFLQPLLWAVFLALVLFPVHRKLQHLLRRGGFLPAMVMTVLVTLVIVLPFTLLMVSLGQEAGDAYHALEEMIQTGRLQATLEQIKELPVLRQS